MYSPGYYCNQSQTQFSHHVVFTNEVPSCNKFKSFDKIKIKNKKFKKIRYPCWYTYTPIQFTINKTKFILNIIKGTLLI